VSKVAMKFLVTGANGFVGSALCGELSQRNYPVLGAVRAEHAECACFERAVVGEIDEKTNWATALTGIDIVIHLAARVHVMQDDSTNPLAEFRKVNVAGTENLARSAAASGATRFVYVSSIKVNGEETHGSKRFTEEDIPSPQDPYGVSKCEAEQVLQRVATETGLEFVIVRPPLVYGAGVKGNFAQMLKVLASGIPLPLASVDNLRSLVYVGNLVDALILCATHPAAAGQTYLISDGEDISTPDLLIQLGAAMGHPARLFSCPLALLKLAGRLIGKKNQMERLLSLLRVDDSKIRRELGWIPTYTLQDSLSKTAKQLFALAQ